MARSQLQVDVDSLYRLNAEIAYYLLFVESVVKHEEHGLGEMYPQRDVYELAMYHVNSMRWHYDEDYDKDYDDADAVA